MGAIYGRETSCPSPRSPELYCSLCECGQKLCTRNKIKEKNLSLSLSTKKWARKGRRENFPIHFFFGKESWLETAGTASWIMRRYPPSPRARAEPAAASPESEKRGGSGKERRGRTHCFPIPSFLRSLKLHLEGTHAQSSSHTCKGRRRSEAHGEKVGREDEGSVYPMRELVPKKNGEG